MGDLISRKALIEAHFNACDEDPGKCFEMWSLDLMWNAPTVEPERKRGYWARINSGNRLYRCSECSLIAVLDGIEIDRYCYCPYCGAKMNVPIGLRLKGVEADESH